MAEAVEREDARGGAQGVQYYGKSVKGEREQRRNVAAPDSASVSSVANVLLHKYPEVRRASVHTTCCLTHKRTSTSSRVVLKACFMQRTMVGLLTARLTSLFNDSSSCCLCWAEGRRSILTGGTHLRRSERPFVFFLLLEERHEHECQCQHRREHRQHRQHQREQARRFHDVRQGWP